MRSQLQASGAFGCAAALYAILGIAILGGVREGAIVGTIALMGASGAIVGALGTGWVTGSRSGADAAARSVLLTLGGAFLFVIVALSWAAVSQGFTPTQVRTLPLALLFALVAGTPAAPLGALAGWIVWRSARPAKGESVFA